MGGLSWICAQKWIKETRDVGAIALSLQPALAVADGAIPYFSMILHNFLSIYNNSYNHINPTPR